MDALIALAAILIGLIGLDIAALDRRTAEDERGIRESQATIEALIRRENARGIASEITGRGLMPFERAIS